MTFNVLTMFVELLCGLSTLSVFFYGGGMVLHLLEVRDSPQALGRPA
jgi:hypothetical protein